VTFRKTKGVLHNINIIILVKPKSTSSTNIITGASRLAKEKSAFVSFSASPNHC
jgi:hypothetical protein